MIEDIRACLCLSLSGHDKGEIYLVHSADERFAYLLDGRIRKNGKPKKKNRKHIKILVKGYEKAEGDIPDELIRKMIGEYKKGKDSGGKNV